MVEINGIESSQFLVLAQLRGQVQLLGKMEAKQKGDPGLGVLVPDWYDGHQRSQSTSTDSPKSQVGMYPAYLEAGHEKTEKSSK